jgi:hypothetical protein
MQQATEAVVAGLEQKNEDPSARPGNALHFLSENLPAQRPHRVPPQQSRSASSAPFTTLIPATHIGQISLLRPARLAAIRHRRIYDCQTTQDVHGKP